MNAVRNPVLWFLIRVAVGGLFAYAGFIKLTEPIEYFEAAIIDYGIFTPPLVPVIARVVPWFECIGGTFLLLGYLPRLSAAAVSLLALGFAALLTASVLTGRGGENCGCFGESGLQLTSAQMLGIDLFSCLSMAGLAKLNVFPLSLHRFLTKQ